MAESESQTARIYTTLDTKSRERAAGLPGVSDDVRLFSLEVAADVITMGDEEVIGAAMDLDGETDSGNDRVIRETVGSMKLVDMYRGFTEKPPAECAGDSEQIEAFALRQLRLALAARRFRVEFPDRFGCDGDGYYSSDAFNRGSVLTKELVAECLDLAAGSEGQADGVS